MTNDVTTPGVFRELAQRVEGGVKVTLLWSARENRLAVTVSDPRAGEWFVLDAKNDNALEVFYHPYAHAAFNEPTVSDTDQRSEKASERIP
jgi:hypothetical protein